ncbi:MAG: sensor domain-containing diguanylate cyclase, partial [Serpentinimonas sp.]|nr:sensor domain-containing diguanylate cyclase [Serpentinimonas sp.]
AIKWSCAPLLLLAVGLPYAQFLPIIWVVSGFSLLALLFLLAKIFLRTRSRVAAWYAAAISVALFASLLEVAAAALGLKGLLLVFNSVTAALASSLLASLAIAEQIRLAHAQRLAAQAELQHTYEVIPIGLFTLDLDGCLSSANPALLHMLGSTEAGLRAQTWPQHFGPAHWQALLEQARSHGTAELELLRQTGSEPARRFQVRAALAGDKLECTLQDITEKAQATEHLKFLAHHDPLTKVLNRRGIEQVLGSGLADLERGHPLAVAYLDLDRFKLINDLYGHAAGDTVLHTVCQRAQSPLIGGMRLGRVGGDEFLIVMPHTPLTQAEAVCREILQQIGGSAC